jgi:hypothetical protein
MREPHETQLPLVEAFGEQLERAIASRGRSRRRSRRRALSLVFAAGLLATSLMTPPGRAASGAVGEWLGLGEPGGPPTVDDDRTRGGLHNEPLRSVVLAAGRAPDGVRYEFVLERLGEPAPSDPAALDSGLCLNVEWPDARVGRISPQFGCYPAVPPATVDKAVVKFGGAMFEPTRTAHVQISGLARSDVGDVRILYKDEHGEKLDAPVDFASVTDAVRERAGADSSFGLFIGFLPQAWLGYGARYDPRACPPKENPIDHEAIDVIAYDRNGDVITSVPGNNINSFGGPSPCR